MSVTRPTLMAGFSSSCDGPGPAAGGLFLVLAASCGDESQDEHEGRQQDGGEAALWHFYVLQK